MKKVFDQTVRDLKREVNKKVLKVPGVEQKVLDATSNEPWGPHGTLLADIAQATRNYHEYQMIMAVIWKRINDTGKNWRHVYKALTVLEYMVANGSERVIDEIREHAYQISTLSDFQYIDSGGRDQGNNVRKKSQSLVQLVNDRERIAEVRQKAAANRDKFRNTSTGGIYRPGSGAYDRYDDERYGSRDEDRNGYGYGREREWVSRDDDRYSRDDRYGRDYEERSSRDGYRDDDYQGRSRSVDNRYDSRSRSSDRDRDCNYDDDGQHSSRGNSAKADEPSLEARLERKLSERKNGAPPSYEEAVGGSRSPMDSERDRGTLAASAPRGSSPSLVSNNPSQISELKGSSPTPVSENPTQVAAAASSVTSSNQEAEAFDEFDPRGPVSAAPAASNNGEMDLLGPLSESFSSNALALVSSKSVSEGDVNANSGSVAAFPVAPSASKQSFEDPFGDSPFKAFPSTEAAPSQPQMYQNIEQHQLSDHNAETVSNIGFGDSISAATYTASGAANTQSLPTNSQFPSQDLSAPQQETDILADILPPAPLTVTTSQQNLAATAQTSLPSFSSSNGQAASQSFSMPTGQFGQQGFTAASSQPGQQPFSVPTSQLANHAFSSPTSQPVQPFSAHTEPPVQQPFSSHTGEAAQLTGNIYGGFHSQARPQNGYNGQISSGNFLPQGTAVPNPSHMASQTPTAYMAAQNANYLPELGGSTTHSTSPMVPQSPIDHASQSNNGSFVGQQGATIPFSSPITRQPLGAPGGKQNSDMLGGLLGQAGSVSSSTTSNATVPHQPSKDKFEMKSTVWADTLSRGLVNLNISGPKINPLADIGVDFDAINRKEKRMEKPTTTVSIASTVTMGKAMGSGSGIGRAGAGALRAPANPMMGSGMGNGPGVGMGIGGGYGGMNPSMGIGMGMGMGGMGMGMNMGMGSGVPMQQQPIGFPSGSNMPGNYNPMTGTGNYTQRPYGGGYQ